LAPGTWENSTQLQHTITAQDSQGGDLQEKVEKIAKAVGKSRPKTLDSPSSLTDEGVANLKLLKFVNADHFIDKVKDADNDQALHALFLKLKLRS